MLRINTILRGWSWRVGAGRSWPLFITALFGSTVQLTAQTFSQLPDMGSSIGPRLTRGVTQSRIERQMFSTIGNKASYLYKGTAYQFATDPEWGRLLFGKSGNWIRDYNNSSGPGGRLQAVSGMDVSARGVVYLADRTKHRIVRATFDRATGTMTSPGQLQLDSASTPTSVAWDGQGNPMTTDYIYVLDDVMARVRYVSMPVGGTPAITMTYGTRGSGTGQFLNPSSVCVGKAPALNGGTTFTTSFYVVDRGNNRIVQLDRYNTTSINWVRSTALIGWDPYGCTVDHFGNVYVSDRDNHKIHKFNPDLTYLDSHGSYGTGATNLNTLNGPRGLSVPCGVKVVGTTDVWYCEGRLLIAEEWTDNTGAVEYYLGVKGTYDGPPTVSGPSAVVEMSLTDNAYVTATVQGTGSGNVRTLFTSVPFYPGSIGLGWDGRKDDGTPAPDGYYHFRVNIRSMYGCPGTSFPFWCAPNVTSADFYYQFCTYPDDPPPDEPLAPEPRRDGLMLLPEQPPPPPTCGEGGGQLTRIVPGGDGAPPTRFAVRQLPTAPTANGGLFPLARTAATRVMTSSGTPIPNGAAGAPAQIGRSGITALQVNVPAAATVEARITDLSGRTIRVIRESVPGAGEYVLQWDGKDASGGVSRPGVYMVVLSDGTARITSRLILTTRPE
jgi:flagellar hook assembly protein FlgD